MAKHELLKKMRIFKALNETELDKLESLVHARSFKPGEKIILEGDAGDDLYLILSGFVNVTRGTGDTAVYLTILGEGEYFGEAGLFHEIKRTATVVASDQAGETTAEIARFARKDFISFIQHHPSAGNHILLQILKDLFSRLQRTSMELQFSKKDILAQDEIDKLLS
jgi:CRP-like cAMP-binding protein